ncbi:MAG: type VI secretion system ImpA family N-terminal domain-containing protein, partial [Myxococcales bacterium]|nr:type VI secretion system ImpA family N-terminal domain-containing protein [Myxococcales bacterium]
MSGEAAGWVPGEDVAPLLQAIPPGSGDRLTDGLAAIEAEVAKLDSPTKQAVGWSVILEEGPKYLKATLKDLRIGTYLALGWGERKGLAGLRQGLDLLVGMLGEPWEQLYPPIDRMKARVGALSWFAEHLGPRVPAMLAVAKPKDEDGKALVESFARYQAALAQRFPQGGPSLRPVEEAFAALQKEGKLPPPPEAPKPKEEQAAAPTSDDPILAPIPGASPVGKDPKLLDEFDQLYVETQKIGAIDGGNVDWKLVRDASAKILANSSKDLRCIVYWGWARFCIDGVKGLAEGAVKLAAFGKQYGANMHPERPKARTAALNWLGERWEGDLPKALQSIPEADANAIKTALDELQAAIDPHVKSIEGIRNARKGLSTIKVDKPKPAPTERPKPAAKAAAVAAAPAGPPAPVVPPELEGLSAQMLAAVDELAAGGETAITLRLRRQALWLAEPPPVRGSKYDCESLAAKDRLDIEAVYKAKTWEDLLGRTESMFASYPFCLDLTFWAAEAAGELLGEDARQALAGELVALAVRAPKLLRGTDRNGMALASKDVRAFISSHRGSGGGAPAAAGAAPAATPAAAPAAGAAPAPVAAAP